MNEEEPKVKSLLDFTQQELEEFDEKLNSLSKYLDDFLKEIRETIEQSGEK